MAQDLKIDNFVFKLHYRFTVVILIVSSVVGGTKQYFGDPISCQVRWKLSCIALLSHFTFHISDCLRCKQQGAEWLLLDSLNLSYQDRVSGQCWLYSGPSAGVWQRLLYRVLSLLRTIVLHQLTVHLPSTTVYKQVYTRYILLSVGSFLLGFTGITFIVVRCLYIPHCISIC